MLGTPKHSEMACERSYCPRPGCHRFRSTQIHHQHNNPSQQHQSGRNEVISLPRICHHPHISGRQEVNYEGISQCDKGLCRLQHTCVSRLVRDFFLLCLICCVARSYLGEGDAHRPELLCRQLNELHTLLDAHAEAFSEKSSVQSLRRLIPTPQI